LLPWAWSADLVACVSTVVLAPSIPRRLRASTVTQPPPRLCPSSLQVRPSPPPPTSLLPVLRWAPTTALSDYSRLYAHCSTLLDGPVPFVVFGTSSLCPCRLLRTLMPGESKQCSSRAADADGCLGHTATFRLPLISAHPCSCAASLRARSFPSARAARRHSGPLFRDAKHVVGASPSPRLLRDIPARHPCARPHVLLISHNTRSMLQLLSLSSTS
jgi:hypothetical protein